MMESAVGDSEEFKRYQDYLDYLQGSLYQGAEYDTGYKSKGAFHNCNEMLYCCNGQGMSKKDER